MTTRRTPDGQVYTEVPVVPRHDQLDGRELGNSHPISAITGLQDALDSKADAVDGGNLVTDDEKAKIETMEVNAQENVVEVVKVNGTPLEPDASKAVDVTVPTAYGKTMTYTASSGKLALKGPTGTTLSEVTIPRKGVTGLALNSDTKVLTATLQDGSTVTANIGAAADPYTAGNGLALANGAFSLSSQTEDLLEDVADHLSDQTAHVSTADRTAWNGVVSNAVKTSGDQTVGGSKTFSNPVTVATPTANGHAATKAYVDAAVAGGGGGGGGTSYTAGTGLTLEGTEFSLSSDTQTTLAAVSGKAADNAVVHNSGAETVAGVKTFSSIPVIPTDTPTQNGQVASKAYVDAAVAGGGGGGGGTAYTAGAGLQLVGTEFSLDSTSQTAVAAVSGKAADSAVVHNTGAETVAGVKTFTSSPLVPTPTTDYQASTKKYVDASVSGKATDTAVVHNSGAETVAGVKTFTSSPIVPTPTTDYEVATKKYVDDNAGGGGGGSGTWTVVNTNEYTTTKFDTLFELVSSDVYKTLKDIQFSINAYYGNSSSSKVGMTYYLPKGTYVNVTSSVVALGGFNSDSTPRISMNLKPKTLFGGSGSLRMIIETMGTSSWTVSKTNVTVSITTTPFSTVANPASGKASICVQYR